MDAISGLGAVLLPVVAGLLFEELTFGGLVRLILAPQPKTSTSGARREGNFLSSRGRSELKNRTEMRGAKCSH